MKKNYVTRLGTLALALTLITTCMMGSTLAKYASAAEGTGAVAIAKWDVKLQDGSGTETGKTFAFNLSDTKDENNNVASGTVAPGDTGVIKYVISDGGNTQVKYNAKVTLNTTGLTETGKVIKFYSDLNNDTEWENIDKTVEAGTAAQDIGGNIYWRWETAAADGDVQDTDIGTKTFPANETFTITLSAEQILPSVTP